MDRAAIVLQARMGSSRLAGKVLATIGERTVLEHCIVRLQINGLPVIVATTTLPADDAIEQEARRLGADVFRGDEHDVLGRFIATAQAFDLTELVRATADNPLVDMQSPRRVLDFRRRVNADHVVECGLPVGGAVEAVLVSALERAHKLITDPYDREHVTSFIRRDGRFRSLRAVAAGDVRRPGLRLTVDTAADLEFVREIFAELGPDESVPALSAAIRVADALLVRAVAKSRMKQGA